MQENIGPGFVVPGLTDVQLINWMVQASRAARATLGASGFISHAPQGPYFSRIGGGGSSSWPGPSGGYTAVWNASAGAINWLNTQFYNQGDSCYVTFQTLFQQSNVGSACTSFPGTSVAEIASYGVPLNAMVVGKPLEANDASNGWVAAADLHTWFVQAQAATNWSAGVMCWSWDISDSAAWIQTVYPS